MIRNCKIDDASEIAKIKINNWRKTYKNIFPDTLLDNLEIESEIEKCINNINKRNAIVYEKDNEVIAYCYYGKRDNVTYKKYDGEVFALYVKNECQEHGIGTKLLNYAIKDLFRQYKNILLWCAKENTRAISFYKKNGLEEITNEIENIGGKNVEKVGLGISLKNGEKIRKDHSSIANEKVREDYSGITNEKIQKDYGCIANEKILKNLKNKSSSEEKYSIQAKNLVEEKQNLTYKMKKSANYIENEKNIAVYTNPDLIFFKDVTKKWFKQIISGKLDYTIPQSFIDYLVKKEIIEVC